MTEIDNYDKAIISVISENAELSATDISKIVHLSRTSVTRRIEVLKDRGIVSTTRAEVEYGALGIPMRALVEVSAPSTSSFKLRDRLLERPEPIQIWACVGERVIIAEILVLSTEHLHHFLNWLQSFGDTDTRVVLKTIPPKMSFKDRLEKLQLENANALAAGSTD